MSQIYALAAWLTRLGFCATFIVNWLFIYLTIRYTTTITGVYKKMLVWFAATCTVTPAIEILVQPFIHNFNGAGVYFSLNEEPIFSQHFLRALLIFYSSLSFVQLDFIVIQFLFRYFTLTQHPFRGSFKGRKRILWLLFYIGSGVLYGVLTVVCLQPDDYSDDYLKEEMLSVYQRDIRDTPRIIAVPYKNGRIRWRVVTFLMSGGAIIVALYTIIIFCSLKMQKAFQSELSNMSKPNRTLERQFFKALTVQILLPTVLLTVPIGSVFLVPLLDMKISCPTGVIDVLYSFYPPLDTIATMLIVQEYRRCLKKLLKDLKEVMTFGRESSANRIS